MKRLIIAATATLYAASTGGAFAQAVDQHAQDQQHRIDLGAQHGGLTPAETQHVEAQHNNIERTESNMRAHDQGHLTQHDRNVLGRRQHHASNTIHRLRHNGRVD